MEGQKRFTESERLDIAQKSFTMRVPDIAREYNVTAGAIRYVLKRPEIKTLIAEIRERKRAAVIDAALHDEVRCEKVFFG